MERALRIEPVSGALSFLRSVAERDILEYQVRHSGGFWPRHLRGSGSRRGGRNWLYDHGIGRIERHGFDQFVCGGRHGGHGEHHAVGWGDHRCAVELRWREHDLGSDIHSFECAVERLGWFGSGGAIRQPELHQFV